MRIALLQLNPTVGDLAGNAQLIVDGLRRAEELGAECVVSSELALVGYPPRDLLERPAFLAEVGRRTAWVVEQSRVVPLIFGTVGVHAERVLTNQAVVAQDGQELGRATKMLLPTYDVFDERRHFLPGSSVCRVSIHGEDLAVSICEDAWFSEPGLAQRYDQDPLAPEKLQGVDLLINLSASPFTLDKRARRAAVFSRLARDRKIPLVMVNQVGGNDELIFDGRSSVWGSGGELLARAKAFEPDLLIATTDTIGRAEPEPADEEECLYQALVLGLRDYARKCGFKSAVLGLSGGIDSAVVAVLAADALGAENVYGLAMPSRYSSAGSVTDAEALARNLGVQLEQIDIERIVGAYAQVLTEPLDRLTPSSPQDVTWENIQARARAGCVMAVSNRTAALPLTTGNKSELAVGYCTLYGDMAGGLSVISDVPKTRVYRLARWINRDRERIPLSTISKPPSAELRPDQTDQDSLPPYEVLDEILLRYVECHESIEDMITAGLDPESVRLVVGLIRRSEYKRRQAAPGLIVTQKAFGQGRRLPVAHGYRD